MIFVLYYVLITLFTFGYFSAIKTGNFDADFKANFLMSVFWPLSLIPALLMHSGSKLSTFLNNLGE